MLHTINDALIGVGAGVAVVAAGYWVWRVRRDPLADAPRRANRLYPEAVLLPVLVWLLSGAGLVALAEARFEGDRLDAAMIWCGNAAQALGCVACLAVAARTFDGGVRRFLFGGGSVGRQLVAGLVYFPAAVSICQLVLFATVEFLSRVDPQYHYYEHEVIEALREGKAPWVTLWIGTVVIAPVAEECFFRGLLQTALENLVRSRWVCVLLTAAVFGAIHAGSGDTPQPHVVPALTVLAILLGVLYARTGSLAAPIVLHAMFNAKTLLFEMLG